MAPVPESCKKKKVRLQEEAGQTARRSMSKCKNKEVRQQEEDWTATCDATEPHGVL